MSCETEAQVAAPVTLTLLSCAIALTLPASTITLTLPDSGTATISSAYDVVLDELGEPILDETACFIKNE